MRVVCVDALLDCGMGSDIGLHEMRFGLIQIRVHVSVCVLVDNQLQARALDMQRTRHIDGVISGNIRCERIQARLDIEFVPREHRRLVIRQECFGVQRDQGVFPSVFGDAR